MSAAAQDDRTGRTGRAGLTWAGLLDAVRAAAASVAAAGQLAAASVSGLPDGHAACRAARAVTQAVCALKELTRVLGRLVFSEAVLEAERIRAWHEGYAACLTGGASVPAQRPRLHAVHN
jgi:hypothetical protein